METADVVTGAFSFTGKYITRRLLALGRRVRTLTGHPNRADPFGGLVKAFPYRFDQPEELARALEGADTLYNTYWIRFPHRNASFEAATENSRILVRAAERAGVRRLVQVSITNPGEDSPLPYFRGKALVEKCIGESSLSHAILRPAVVFGPEDILINNIAWFLRRFPAFAVFGRGDSRLQPIFVEDLADLAVEWGRREENQVLDAVGPDAFTFEELVRLVAEKIGRKARILHLPPALAWSLASVVGRLLGDVTLTRDEVEGLLANLLISREPPRGTTRLADWLSANAADVGRKYASEVERHYR